MKSRIAMIDKLEPGLRKKIVWAAGIGMLILAAVSVRGVSAQNEVASRAAFLTAYQVFMSPRCMNCHPQGDVPLQGEDSHPHLPIVKRGVDGKGLFALKCTNCHQTTNLPGPNMPPGSPVWHMPPREFPMVFQGRTPAELARQMLDPKLNGNKTPEQIIHHAESDPLVKSCWEPNTNGRPLPPVSHQEFAKAVREWIEKGAVIPEESLAAAPNHAR